MPTACQKVTCRNPKSGGSSQFHSSFTTSPPTATASATSAAIPTIANGAMKISFHIFLVFMFGSSCVREFVVDVLQPLAQVPHRVALARQERVHAHAGFGGHLLEAASFQLVRHK